MKTAQSFRIHFVVRAYKAKDGEAPLYVAVTVNKEKCLIGLKKSIELNNWDADKGLPKGNREQVKILNNYLDEVRLALGNCYKDMMLKGRVPSATKKYLTVKIPGFDYREQFGGVVYLFLRGLRKSEENGIFSCVPPLEQIEKLENILLGSDWAFRRYVTLCSVAKLTTCLLAKKCSLCFSSINKDNYLPISI